MEDSSVLFNLNEIMRLERDRVDAEAAAVRAAEANARAEREARAREERERVALERAAAVERERAAVERAREAARADEAERTAALLRVRLEAEAQQQLAAQQLELAYADRLRELAELQRRKRASFGIAAALVTVCLSAGAAYIYVLEPALRSARDRSSALDQLTADAAAQTEALTRQMQELKALREQADNQRATSSAQTGQVAQPKRPKAPASANRKPPARPATQTAAPDTALDTLDTSNNDPLFGLGSDAPSKRKRR